MSHPIETWWAPWQLKMVQDTSRPWRRETFVPSGAVEEVSGGTRLLRKAQPSEITAAGPEAEWDHEHCALCWSKISLHPDDNPVGFTDGEDWLCCKCHQAYIAPCAGSDSA